MVIVINSTPNKRIAQIIAGLGSFLAPLMASSINVALPTIGKEFAIDAVLLGWISTAYLLASAMFLVPFGKIADMYGRKRIYTYGIIVYMSASLLASLTPSAVLLIFYRALQGTGAAMIFGTGVAILSSTFPAEERGKALGINVAIVYMGQSIGPFLGGVLTEQLGWRSVFYSAIPLCLLALILVRKLQGEWAESRGEKFNFISSGLYSVSLMMIMYGLTVLPEIKSLWFIVPGLSGFVLLLRREAKVDNPLINVNLFKHNRVFAFSNLATLINFSATFAVVFILSLYLQYIQALSPRDAGLVIISKSIVQGIFSPVTGRLSDRIEPRIIASTGMALITAALFMFSFLGTQTPLALIITNLILLGFGISLFSSPNTNAVMSSVDEKYYGISSATLGTMRVTGNLLSMAIVMLIFSLSVGRVEITPEYHPAFLSGIRTAFAVFSILSLGGVFASLARGKIPKREPSQDLFKEA